MGGMSLIHWIIVGAVLLLLFGGKGKISDVMGDGAKGIKSFKKGLSEDDESKLAATHPAEPARTIDHQPQAPSYVAPVTQPVVHEAAPRKVG